MSRRPKKAVLAALDAPEDVTVRGRLSLPTVWMNEGGPGQGLLVTIGGRALEHVSPSHILIGPERRRVELVDGVIGSAKVRWCEVQDVRVEAQAKTERKDKLDRVAVAVEGAVVSSGKALLEVTVSCLDSDEAETIRVELDLHA